LCCACVCCVCVYVYVCVCVASSIILITSLHPSSSASRRPPARPPLSGSSNRPDDIEGASGVQRLFQDAHHSCPIRVNFRAAKYLSPSTHSVGRLSLSDPSLSLPTVFISGRSALGARAYTKPKASQRLRQSCLPFSAAGLHIVILHHLVSPPVLDVE